MPAGSDDAVAITGSSMRCWTLCNCCLSGRFAGPDEHGLEVANRCGRRRSRRPERTSSKAVERRLSSAIRMDGHLRRSCAGQIQSGIATCPGRVEVEDHHIAVGGDAKASVPSHPAEQDLEVLTKAEEEAGAKCGLPKQSDSGHWRAIYYVADKRDADSRN